MITRGSYLYLLNGEPTEVLENWKIEGEFSGECQISSRRSAAAIEIEVEALMVNGVVQHFDVSYQKRGAEHIAADYRLGKEGLYIECSDVGCADKECMRFSRDDDGSSPVLFPLMRIFTGPQITQLLAQGGSGNVVQPFIGPEADNSSLLRPQKSERSARVLEPDTFILCDGEEMPCRCCEYIGDQYTAGSRFWLGEEGYLLRYQWQQSPDQLWDVSLVREV